MQHDRTAQHEPTTHDYTRRGWGHDFSIHRVIDGGQRLKVSGWGRGIRQGDYILLPDGDATTRYLFGAVKYYRDPSDMWAATLVFAPRVAVAAGDHGTPAEGQTGERDA